MNKFDNIKFEIRNIVSSIEDLEYSIDDIENDNQYDEDDYLKAIKDFRLQVESDKTLKVIDDNTYNYINRFICNFEDVIGE